MAEVRVCEFCGHPNPIIAMACEVCGADLAFVQPTEREDDFSEKELDIGFVLINSSMRFAIAKTIEIGRMSSEMADLLNQSDYTSRHHADLVVDNGKLSVIDKSSNGTYVNGNRIPKGVAVELHDGDSIKFADVEFMVEQC